MWGDTDMTKPRIIIVDEDESYAMTLQAKFIYEFLDNIELEVITDQKIIDKTFAQLFENNSIALFAIL